MKKRYRIRPVEIEAIKMENVTFIDMRSFCGCNNMKNVVQNYDTNEIISFIIPTLEGDIQVNYGDYIIKGINGEFYSCKPDVFVKNYEEIGGNNDKNR